MIKLFVSDLDGTLLNEMHMTDSFILETIQLVKENGYLFSTATGRSLHEHEVNRLQLNNCFRISMNGALIKNPQGEVLYSQPIDSKCIEEFIELFYGMDCDYSSDDFTLSTISMEEKIEYFKKDGFKEIAGSPLRIRDFLKDYKFNQNKEDIKNKNIYKINCTITDQTIQEQFRSFIDKHKDLIVNAPAEENHFELTSKQVNKGHAVSVLLKHLKLDKEEVMVFGDGGNDLEMLSMYPYSCAMANGSIMAQVKASRIIGYNKDYAVCKEMLKYIE